MHKLDHIQVKSKLRGCSLDTLLCYGILQLKVSEKMTRFLQQERLGVIEKIVEVIIG